MYRYKTQNWTQNSKTNTNILFFVSSLHSFAEENVYHFLVIREENVYLLHVSEFST